MFKKGDVVVCVDAKHREVSINLTEGKRYDVVRDSYGQTTYVIDDKGRDKGLCTDRFVLAKAPRKAKAAIIPAKVDGVFNPGDKVVVVEAHYKLPLGSIQVVKQAFAGNVDLEDPQGLRLDGFYPHRFKHAPAEAKPIKAKPVKRAIVAGSTVTCINAANTNLLRLNGRYTVEKVYLNGALKIVGIGPRYQAARFKLVALPKVAKPVFDRATWEPAIGEMVYVIGEPGVAGRFDGQERFINNGVAYKINDVQPKAGWAKLDTPGNGWAFEFDSLIPAEHYAPGIKPVAAAKPVSKDIPKPIPKPVYEDLREELFSLVRSGGICSYGFEYVNGTRKFEANDVCHARLSRYAEPEITKLVYGIRKELKFVEKKDIDAYKAYVDFMLNRSPWADCFITKDIEEAITKDVFMNVEKDKDAIAGACIAMRCGAEQWPRAITFHKLCKMGVDERVAFMICPLLSVNAQGSWSIQSWYNGHDWLGDNYSMDDYVKFFKQGYHLKDEAKKKPYRIDHYGYTVAAAIARYNGLPTVGGWVKDNLKPVVVGEGWAKSSKIGEESVKQMAALLLDKLNKEA